MIQGRLEAMIDGVDPRASLRIDCFEPLRHRIEGARQGAHVARAALWNVRGVVALLDLARDVHQGCHPVGGLVAAGVWALVTAVGILSASWVVRGVAIGVLVVGIAGLPGLRRLWRRAAIPEERARTRSRIAR